MSRAAGFSLTTATPVPAAGTPVTHLRGSLPGRAGSHGPVPGSLVDDVQGAPPEDREALAAHADVSREAPLMVVCAVTEDCGPEVAGFLARLARSGARLIEVGPMDVADVEELLRAGSSRTGGAVGAGKGPGPAAGPRTWCPSGPDLPGAFAPLSAEAARLHAPTGGNAFYLTELLGTSGGLSVGTSVRVPHAVRCEVRARLAALSPDARRVVETAVLSGPVGAWFLAHACELPLTAVLRALEDAADTGLMTWQRADGPSPPAAYAFSCELVRGTLLADIPPSRAHAARTAVARVKSGRRSRGPTWPPCRLPPHHPTGLMTGKVPYVPECHFFTRSPARRFTGGGT